MASSQSPLLKWLRANQVKLYRATRYDPACNAAGAAALNSERALGMSSVARWSHPWAIRRARPSDPGPVIDVAADNLVLCVARPSSARPRNPSPIPNMAAASALSGWSGTARLMDRCAHSTISNASSRPMAFNAWRWAMPAGRSGSSVRSTSRQALPSRRSASAGSPLRMARCPSVASLLGLGRMFMICCA